MDYVGFFLKIWVLSLMDNFSGFFTSRSWALIKKCNAYILFGLNVEHWQRNDFDYGLKLGFGFKLASYDFNPYVKYVATVNIQCLNLRVF